MRLSNTVCVAVVGALMLGSAGALAQGNTKAPGSGPNPYTDCGIGAALFPNTHWAAVTSNVIWDVGTTAVISATASPETCQGASAEAAAFINDAYDNVLEDTARGDGEYLVALLQIYGCTNEAQSDIVDAIRSDIGMVVSRDGYAAMPKVKKAETYFNVIDREIRSGFTASCTA